MSAPEKIPNSKAINIVPAPIPLRASGDKSAVQAKIVGDEIPVAIPKIIDAIVYDEADWAVPMRYIEKANKLIPINNTSLLPIRSESLPAVNRMIIVAIT